MPKYRVREKSLIGNEIFEAGAEVEYAGLPAENLEPLDDEGRAKAAEYAASNEARIAKMRADNPASGVGDPAAFMKLLLEQREQDRIDMATTIAKAVAEALAAAFPNGMHKPAAPPAEPDKLA